MDVLPRCYTVDFCSCKTKIEFSKTIYLCKLNILIKLLC